MYNSRFIFNYTTLKHFSYTQFPHTQAETGRLTDRAQMKSNYIHIVEPQSSPETLSALTLIL